MSRPDFFFGCHDKTHPHCLSPACRHKLLIMFHNGSEGQGSTKLMASSKTGSTQTEFLLKHTPSPISQRSVSLLMDANNNVLTLFNTIVFCCLRSRVCVVSFNNHKTTIIFRKKYFFRDMLLTFPIQNGPLLRRHDNMEH